MENNRFSVFRALARTLNPRLAAKELQISQPAVRSLIKALEHELSTPLFDRKRGALVLTRAGEVLMPYTEEIDRLSEEARAAVLRAAAPAPRPADSRQSTPPASS